MLGLSQPALRSWEERYGLVVAERSDGGRRIYTREQVEQLRFIKGRLDEGLSAADAHRLLAECQAGAQPIVERRTSDPAARLLVLLAQSDRYGAELNDFFLRTEGYEVEIALTADDAEQKFASQDPALSIVELMISGGVGGELCQRLKRRRETPLVGFPFNRSRMPESPGCKPDNTTRARWGSSRRGFGPTPTVWTSWSG